MRILSIFKIAGLLVIAIIVAAVAIVVAVDPNQFKGELQDAVRDATGRDLVIDGDIGLSLGLTTGLSIENVRFSNAEWGTAPDLLRAKEVVVQVAVLPLFAERFVIRGLVIRDAHILIERDAKGRSNLDMRATEPAAAPASGFTRDADRDDISFNISQATVENSTLTIRDAARKSEDVLVAESLELTPDHARLLLEIDLEGTLSTGGQPLPLKVTGTIGFIETLIAGNLPYPLDIRGEALDIAFAVKGEIGNVAKFTGLALDVDVSGPDLSPISRFTGIDLPPNLAFTAAGKVSGGGDRYAVAGLKLALGNTDAGGDIAISLAGARPRIEGEIRATRIDLTELDLPQAAGAPETTADTSTAPGTSGGEPSGRAFSDTALPLDALKAFDAKLAISIAELIGPDYRFDRINATIALDDGALSAAPLDIRGEAFDTAFAIKGEIGNVAKLTGLALDIDVSGPDLSPFSRFTGVELPPNLAFTAAGKVSGGGDRYAVAGLKLALGNTDVGGDIAISFAGTRPRIEGTIRATRIDLTELDLPQAAGAPETTADTSTAPGTSDGETSGRVFPDTALPLDALKAFDAKLAISIAELTGPTLEIDKISATITLGDGDLTIDPLGFSLSGSAVKGAVRIAENTNPATVEVKLASPDLDVGKIIRDQLDIDLLRGSGAVDIDLSGNGDSLAAIMASLNGYSRVIMKKGEARTAEIETIVGGLSSVLTSFVVSKKEWTVVNCLASEFKFSDGIATSQVMLVDGEFMTLVGSGQIDLGNETLALTVTPASKSVTISGVVPVSIGGTIANPTFAPEAIGTVSKIGRLFGYFLFPPSAVTALADMVGSDNRCIEIAQGGAAK